MNMIITDKKNTAYANVCLNSPFSVKAEARDGGDGGYCALFYVDGRSVALGRKETLDEARAMITDFINIFRAVSVEMPNEVVRKEYIFDYDEPVEIEDETESDEAENKTEDNNDDGEHFE